MESKTANITTYRMRDFGLQGGINRNLRFKPNDFSLITHFMHSANVTSPVKLYWYVVRVTDPLLEKAAELTSEEMRDSIINEWQALNLALQSGDLRTGYFRGRKPA